VVVMAPLMPRGRKLIARSGQPRSVTSTVAAILLAVSDRPAQSLTEIARRTRLPRSTTHRLLAA
jgi:DNA-binding MarR family transcriptional regulator